MKQKQINLRPGILDSISKSREADENEKLGLLKFVGYLTLSEQKELATYL